MAHKQIPTIGLLAVSVLVMLAVVEGTLRLVPSLLSPGARLHISERRAPAWYVPHPYLGHLHRPQRHAHDPWGFRNPWPWPTPVDILAVGDSFTYGYQVTDEEAWPARLTYALTPRTVVNLGLIGAAPQQYLRLYETFGLARTSKVLLVGIFLGNDLWGAKEFEQWWQAGGMGAFPDAWREKKTPGLRGWIRDRLGHLYLVALWQDVQASYRTGRLFGGTTLTLASGERLQLVPSLLAQTAAAARPGSAKFTLVLDTIARIHALSQQHQAQCVILFFPSKEEVYLPLLEEHVPDLAAAFLPSLDQRGIAYLNLSPSFRARAAAGEKLFFEVDGHPNTQGHALIAEVVGAYLTRQAQLDGPGHEPSPR
jgi:hypothetical protein